MIKTLKQTDSYKITLEECDYVGVKNEFVLGIHRKSINGTYFIDRYIPVFKSEIEEAVKEEVKKLNRGNK